MLLPWSRPFCVSASSMFHSRRIPNPSHQLPTYLQEGYLIYFYIPVYSGLCSLIFLHVSRRNMALGSYVRLCVMDLFPLFPSALKITVPLRSPPDMHV